MTSRFMPSSWVRSCTLGVAFVVLTVAVSAVEAAGDEPVTVELSGWAGGGPAHKPTLRRLIRILKGDVQLSSGHYGLTHMVAARVISGGALDPAAGQQPNGVRSIGVYFLNDALSGGEVDPSDSKRFAGIWTLHPLPGGDFAVWDVKDTPFPAAAAAKRRAQVAGIMQGIVSKDRAVQLDAFEQWKKVGFVFSEVPRLIALVDDVSPIPPGFGASTLGEFSRGQLVTMAKMLDDKSPVTLYDSAGDYQAWWQGLLAGTESELSELPGPIREVLALPGNQSRPEIIMSPDGRRAVLGFTRLDAPMEGARNGIALLGLEKELEKRFVYKVPLDAVNVEPQEIQAAWDGDRVGLAWLEQWYDADKSAVRFMVNHPDARQSQGPAHLRIRGGRKLALVRRGDAWVLAYTTEKTNDERYGAKENELFLVVLDDEGAFQVGPMALPLEPDHVGLRTVSSLSMIDTPRGLALAVASGTGPLLILLGQDLKAVKTVSFRDARLAHSYGALMVERNRRELCIVWQGWNNDGLRLFATFFDLDGTIRDTRVLSESLEGGSAPRLVQHQDGFAASWVDQVSRPHVLTLAKISSASRQVSKKAAYLGDEWLDPISLGMQGRNARVMLVDRKRYPYKVLLKDAKVGD